MVTPCRHSHSKSRSANLHMYATVDDVGDINDRDLKRLGIRNLAHRQKMLNSLLGVRAKRRQSMNLEGSYKHNQLRGILLSLCVLLQPCAAVHPARCRVARARAPWSICTPTPTRICPAMAMAAVQAERLLPPKVARFSSS